MKAAEYLIQHLSEKESKLQHKNFKRTSLSHRTRMHFDAMIFIFRHLDDTAALNLFTDLNSPLLLAARDTFTRSERMVFDEQGNQTYFSNHGKNSHTGIGVTYYSSIMHLAYSIQFGEIDSSASDDFLEGEETPIERLGSAKDIFRTYEQGQTGQGIDFLTFMGMLYPFNGEDEPEQQTLFQFVNLAAELYAIYKGSYVTTHMHQRHYQRIVDLLRTTTLAAATPEPIYSLYQKNLDKDFKNRFYPLTIETLPACPPWFGPVIKQFITQLDHNRPDYLIQNTLTDLLVTVETELTRYFNNTSLETSDFKKGNTEYKKAFHYLITLLMFSSEALPAADRNTLVEQLKAGLPALTRTQETISIYARNYKLFVTMMSVHAETSTAFAKKVLSEMRQIPYKFKSHIFKQAVGFFEHALYRDNQLYTAEGVAAAVNIALHLFAMDLKSRHYQANGGPLAKFAGKKYPTLYQKLIAALHSQTVEADYLAARSEILKAQPDLYQPFQAQKPVAVALEIEVVRAIIGQYDGIDNTPPVRNVDFISS